MRHYERPRAGFFSKKPIVKALGGVSFSVWKGESFGIVGESGAGKSTLARLLLALEKPTSGTVRFKGENLFGLPADRKLAARRHIQMIFQNPFETLDPKHKVLSVVGEPLALMDGVGDSERETRVKEALVDVGLDAGDVDKFPHEFSGGQRQRIAIARALITRPDLIVADEPVSAQDGKARTQIIDLMTELKERFALTYIVISQNPSVIRDITGRFAVMRSGVIVEQGDTERLFGSPRHAYTKKFLGATLDAGDGGTDGETSDEETIAFPKKNGADTAFASRPESDLPTDDKAPSDADAPAGDDDTATVPAPVPVDEPATPIASPPPAAPAMPRGIDASAAVRAADAAIASAIASARGPGKEAPAKAAHPPRPRIVVADEKPAPSSATTDGVKEAAGKSTVQPVNASLKDGAKAERSEPAGEATTATAEAQKERGTDAPDRNTPPSPSTPAPERPKATPVVSPPPAAPESPAPDRPTMMEGRNLIGGQWLDASDDRLLKVIDPSDGQRLGYIARGTTDDVDRAVRAARRALDGPWGRLPAFERGRLLAALARLVLDNVEHLAKLEAKDVGKPLRQARADAVALARYFEFYGGSADKVHGETIPYHDGYTVLTLREPHGVTGHIVPWNYPMQIIGRSVGAALAMGNACVLKPGEDASLTALEIGRLALEAGLPPGVLNIVTGLGEEAGAALADHPGIDHLSFTGSVETGRSVQRAAAGHCCPVTLELGGKSPQIVFADADLDQTLPFLVNAVIQNAGQTCSAGSRVLIQDWIYDELTHRLAERFEQLDVGPAERDLDCGPVINPIQKRRIETYLDHARSERIAVLGEGEIAPETPDGGFYVKPTLLGDVPPDHRLAQEEVFGPVLSAIRFNDEEDAVRVANDSAYGLVAGVWTRDGGRQMRLARAIKTGQVFVNNYGAGGGVELPFGGVKNSGYGREKGFEALYGFSTLKTVAIRHG